MKKILTALALITAASATQAYETQRGYEPDLYGEIECGQDYLKMAASPDVVFSHNHQPFPYDGPGDIQFMMNVRVVLEPEGFSMYGMLAPQTIEFKDFVIVSGCGGHVNFKRNPTIYKISKAELKVAQQIRKERSEAFAKEGKEAVSNFGKIEVDSQPE